MAINIDKMSLADLISLKADIESAILARKETERATTLARLRALATEAGFSLEELVTPTRKFRGPASDKSDRRSAVAPKYAHPDNPTATWTGRGKPPRWLAELEAAGRNRDEFLIANH